LAQKMRNTPVRLSATHELAIDSGVTLPAGIYPGRKREIGLEKLAGVEWNAPEYWIDLKAEQLGGPGKPQNLSSASYDVTKFVRTGDMVVA
jgi:hypothetical protein